MKQKSLLCGGTYTAAPRLSELCSALPSGGRALQARGSPSPTPRVSWGKQVKVSTGLLVTPSSVQHFRLWCLSGGCTSPSSQSDQGCPLLFLWALQQAWRVLLALLPPGGVSSINPLCRHRQLLLPAQSCAHCPLSTPSDACPST